MKEPEQIKNTVSALMTKIPLRELFWKRENFISNYIAKYASIDVDKFLDELRRLKSYFLGE